MQYVNVGDTDNMLDKSVYKFKVYKINSLFRIVSLFSLALAGYFQLFLKFCLTLDLKNCRYLKLEQMLMTDLHLFPNFINNLAP